MSELTELEARRDRLEETRRDYNNKAALCARSIDEVATQIAALKRAPEPEKFPVGTKAMVPVIIVEIDPADSPIYHVRTRNGYSARVRESDLLPVPAPTPERCPKCNSPKPHLHPAVQFEGEVEICRPRRATVSREVILAALGKVGVFRADCVRSYEAGGETQWGIDREQLATELADKLAVADPNNQDDEDEFKPVGMSPVYKHGAP